MSTSPLSPPNTTAINDNSQITSTWSSKTQTWDNKYNCIYCAPEFLSLIRELHEIFSLPLPREDGGRFHGHRRLRRTKHQLRDDEKEGTLSNNDLMRQKLGFRVGEKRHIQLFADGQSGGLVTRVCNVPVYRPFYAGPSSTTLASALKSFEPVQSLFSPGAGGSAPKRFTSPSMLEQSLMFYSCRSFEQSNVLPSISTETKDNAMDHLRTIADKQEEEEDDEWGTFNLGPAPPILPPTTPSSTALTSPNEYSVFIDMPNGNKVKCLRRSKRPLPKKKKRRRRRTCRNNAELLRVNKGKHIGIQLRDDTTGQWMDGKILEVIGEDMVILSAGACDDTSKEAGGGGGDMYNGYEDEEEFYDGDLGVTAVKSVGGEGAVPTVIPLDRIALIAGWDNTALVTTIIEEIKEPPTKVKEEEDHYHHDDDWLLEYRGKGGKFSFRYVYEGIGYKPLYHVDLSFGVGGDQKSRGFLKAATTKKAASMTHLAMIVNKTNQIQFFDSVSCVVGGGKGGGDDNCDISTDSYEFNEENRVSTVAATETTTTTTTTTTTGGGKSSIKNSALHNNSRPPFPLAYQHLNRESHFQRDFNLNSDNNGSKEEDNCVGKGGLSNLLAASVINSAVNINDENKNDDDSDKKFSSCDNSASELPENNEDSKHRNSKQPPFRVTFQKSEKEKPDDNNSNEKKISARTDDAHIRILPSSLSLKPKSCVNIPVFALQNIPFREVYSVTHHLQQFQEQLRDDAVVANSGSLKVHRSIHIRNDTDAPWGAGEVILTKNGGESFQSSSYSIYDTPPGADAIINLSSSSPFRLGAVTVQYNCTSATTNQCITTRYTVTNAKSTEVNVELDAILASFENMVVEQSDPTPQSYVDRMKTGNDKVGDGGRKQASNVGRRLASNRLRWDVCVPPRDRLAISFTTRMCC